MEYSRRMTTCHPSHLPALDGSGAGRPFRGAIEGVAIYDAALTPAEIQAWFGARRERMR